VPSDKKRERERERELKRATRQAFLHPLRVHNMASASDIRNIIQEGNAQLRKDLSKDIMEKVTQLIETTVNDKLAATRRRS
jgi:hypothetical protein